MIPHQQDDKFISHGVKNNNQFKLLNNSAIMDILSNRIYSDKFAAVIREIGCNAYDAHIAADKKEVPFLVKLPTSYDKQPELSIRDFGKGLSKEDVAELYTTYGYSSKTESNDYIGFMGIGSKSPFCYSSTFQVISYHNGMKYSFLMFKDEGNIPNISFLGEWESNEDSGLEIIIPVQKSDIYTFESRVKDIFGWFDTIPIIFSGTNQLFIKNKKESYKDFHGINILVDGSDSVLTARVKMGNVVYILDNQQIPVLMGNNHAFNSFSFLIEVNIGEIEVDSGREKIQYTKSVIKTLNDKIKQITEDIKTEANLALEKVTKLTAKKLICKNFFKTILDCRVKNYYGSYASSNNFYLSNTFNVNLTYFSDSVILSEKDIKQLPTKTKIVKKTGLEVDINEERYPQNSFFSIGNIYTRGKFITSLKPSANIDLLKHKRFFFYKEGESLDKISFFIKENYNFDKNQNSPVFPLRVKQILIDEYEIEDEFIDISIDNVKIIKEKTTNILTFPIKLLDLSGYITYHEKFEPKDNCLYITVPFKYSKLESPLIKYDLSETKFKEKISFGKIQKSEILSVLTNYDKKLTTDKTEVSFLLLNSKNKKQIEDNGSYLSIEKFLNIVSLDAKNKLLYPTLDSQDVEEIYDLFIKNNYNFRLIKSTYEFAKKIVPVLFKKGDSLFDLIQDNQIEKEFEDIESIFNILKLNDLFQNMFTIMSLTNVVNNDPLNHTSTKKILLFNKYSSYLYSVQNYLEKLKRI